MRRKFSSEQYWSITRSGLSRSGRTAGGRSDVLILSADVVNEVQNKGCSPAGSASPLGSVGVGLAVKQGAAMPDVSSPETLRQTLLAAKSLTCMDPQKGTSGKHFAGGLQQLGIADQVRAKTTLGDVGYVLEPVARGEIELGVQQITEILPVKGAALVGTLPPQPSSSARASLSSLEQAQEKSPCT